MMADSSMYGSTSELMAAASSDFVEKASGGHSVKRRGLLSRQKSSLTFDMGAKKIEQVLTPEEKRFLLFVERGDCASASKLIKAYKTRAKLFDINCTDPLGRSGLSIAIINENPEMMELLLEENIKVKDALLLAIAEEYVEGVELLLQHEERSHEPGTPYSWEAVDMVSANYTPDITPLILAAHKNNYEILKILLDRGASLPTPHDLKCSCEACITASQEDSLRFSLSRINSYRALASPSLIALTSSDPILTAFQLSDELKKLKQMESQFCEEFTELRHQVQSFATSLLDHARTSYELEIMLNYDLSGEIWDPGETQTLHRLKLALRCKQKAFVAHPNVQQLLATIWYEGLPGWRRMNILSQAFELVRLGLMFPIYCVAYMIAPTSSSGVFMKKPFVKFICHSASFLCFLTLLACASQRLERITMQFLSDTFGITYLRDVVEDWKEKERGCFPTPIECMIIFWVIALMWKDVKEVYEIGLKEYVLDLWNLADIFTNICFTGWIVLRITAYIIVKKEESAGLNPYLKREDWHAYDPFLISEGLFGAGMISSNLKLVHIFAINPHLGPLQISLGRMIVDIVKFMVLCGLVLFAFGCGLNQLLWYYADLEWHKCYDKRSGLPEIQSNACIVWRRFANLWETCQSLFWACFGLVSLTDFELTGIKEFTRFWALLMFGSYSVCNIIVLLNMLIAMMSNSFQIISEKSDTEWKFARTKLWISYFETGSTVPPPFNIIPTPKFLWNKICRCCRGTKSKSHRIKIKNDSTKREMAAKRYRDVMKCIIRRYITAEQKKAEEFSITEDDVSEIRQDINKFRYELIDILRNNNFNTPEIRISDVYVSNKRAKQTQRRILKGFNINTVETAIRESLANEKGEKKDFFKVVAKAIGNKDRTKVDSANGDANNPIGNSKTLHDRRAASFRKSINQRSETSDGLNQLTPSELVEYNPLLETHTPTTRLAYAKFKSFTLKRVKEEEKPSSSSNNENAIENLEKEPSKNATTFENENTKSGSGSGGNSQTTSIQINQVHVLQQPQQHTTNNNNNGTVVSLNSENHPETLAPISKINKKLIHFSPPSPVGESQQSNIQQHHLLHSSPKIDSSPTLSQKSIGSQSSSDYRESSFARSRGIINQNRDPDQNNRKKLTPALPPNKNSSTNQHSLVSRRTGKPLQVTLPKDLISSTEISTNNPQTTTTEQQQNQSQSPSKFNRPRNNNQPQQQQSSISLSVRSLPRSSSSISSTVTGRATADRKSTHGKLLVDQEQHVPPSSGHHSDSTIIPFVDESTSSSSDQDFKSETGSRKSEVASAAVVVGAPKNKKNHHQTEKNNDEQQDSVEKTTNNPKVVIPGASNTSTVISKSQNRKTGWL